MDSYPYSYESFIFTLGAPHEEVQGRQTKLHPGFTISKLVQPSPGTVKPVHTGMPWGPIFIPVWTGSGSDRIFAFGEEETTITCTVDMRVIIQDVSSVGIQVICG